MKKLLGLIYHLESELPDGKPNDFYNFYPSLLLTDEYTYDPELGLYEISWGDDPDIDGLFPNYQNPNLRNINIACKKELNNGEYVYGRAKELWGIPTWAVLDVEFMYKHLKKIDVDKGKYVIPFIRIENVDTSIVNNDCYLVIKRSHVKDQFETFANYFDYYTERFLIMEDEKKYTGPYTTSDGTYPERDGSFANWSSSQKCFDMDIIGLGNDFCDNFHIQVILKNSLTKITRGPSVPKPLIATPKDILSPDTTTKNIEEEEKNKENKEIKEINKIIEEQKLQSKDSPKEELNVTNEKEESLAETLVKDDSFFPQNFNLPIPLVEVQRDKVNKTCTSTGFSNDIASSKTTAPIKKLIFSELYKMNVANPEMIEPLVPKVGAAKRTKPINAFSSLLSEGYLCKVTLDKLGTIYCASKRGLDAYGFKKVCKSLDVEYGWEASSECGSFDARAYAARIAYAKIATDINTKTEYRHRIPFVTRDSYIVTFANKDNLRNVVIGIFDERPYNDFSKFEEHIKEILNVDNDNLLRLISCGINKEHSFAIARSIKDFYKGEMSTQVYTYSLEEDKYYNFTLDKDIESDAIWSKEIEENIIKEEKRKQEELEQEEAERLKNREENEAKERKEKALQDAMEAEAQKELKIKELQGLEDQISNAKKVLENCQQQIDDLSTQSKEIIRNTRKAIDSPDFARVTIDGYLASHMMKAAAEWEAGQRRNEYKQYCEKLSSLPDDEIHENLIDYVVEKVKKARPTYSENEIINIAICIAQGFITVFSGPPGSGKTSICTIFSQILGLDIPVEGFEYSRYIPISVGRGWTSQRDFIGYYNPLSKEFETSNQLVFDAFKLGNEEYGNSKYPIFILLDEANLSPMEHYWSEFIRICDNRLKYNSINCGGNEIFRIPDTMRFLATINNDDTTTSLSPRMVDRAWVVTLPTLKAADFLEKGREFEEKELKRIPWKAFTDTFGPRQTDSNMETTVMKLLEDIMEKVPGLNVNFRVYKSILDYYSAAVKCFRVKDNKFSALDYAVSQRIIPKISGADGQGDDYGKQLESLRDYLANCNFAKSAALVNDIIERGQSIGYYQFF